MKKRNSVSSAALMGAGLIVLAACDEAKVDAAVYESVQQCITNGDASREQCEQNFKEAKSQHAAVAPKYASREDCQADFGAARCEEAPYKTSGGGSIFMPLMMGYMMGSMIGGRRSMASQPLYRSAKSPNSFRTANNRSVGSAIGRTRVATSAASRPSVKTSTMSRGGFGASGRRFGSAAT